MYFSYNSENFAIVLNSSNKIFRMLLWLIWESAVPLRANYKNNVSTIFPNEASSLRFFNKKPIYKQITLGM